MDIDSPAILGGDPVFENKLGIVRPQLPKLSSIQERLKLALISGQLTNQGKYVETLEKKLSEYFGVSHVITTSNATLGLIIVLKALEREGEVILPSFTFAATGHAVSWAGLKPVFADILPDTYTLNPESVAELINKNTVAAMGVHIYGHPCEIDELSKIAVQNRLELIFDSAHAFGSYYKNKIIGSFGRAEVLSFHATKIFPVGEGGAILTNDGELATRLKLLRVFGDPGTENTQLIGLNAKMQEFNALIGLENLKVINRHIETRRKRAQLMKSLLNETPGLQTQKERSYVVSNYQNFPLCIEENRFGLDRDQLCSALLAENIGIRKYFYPPLHKHKSYINNSDGNRKQLNVTNDVSNRILCIPIYSDTTEEEVHKICFAIKKIYLHSKAIRKFIIKNDKN
ncbi:MAG: DegT/DnrJ/EryC1/StrS family aminotransferase [Candidatus Heimdallarchaeota archaeon]|nr:MAG: DegT/DnrJ/EryC1/StrS family aminotransferase [Candidatus Heimdallarchaeota archaeon]